MALAAALSALVAGRFAGSVPIVVDDLAVDARANGTGLRGVRHSRNLVEVRLQ